MSVKSKKTRVDLTSWNRSEHFHFFKEFDEPFFGITTHVDCTKAYHRSKNEGFSFYLYYLYQSLRAINESTSFRYRMESEKVWLYERIHASTTLLREDKTFAFTFVPYTDTFEEFVQAARLEFDDAMNSTGLRMSESTNRADVIHYSSIPWFPFTAISHARAFKFEDSIPKFTFGKFQEENGNKKLPVSLHVHHGMMDGYHVGQFLELFQQFLLD